MHQGPWSGFTPSEAKSSLTTYQRPSGVACTPHWRGRGRDVGISPASQGQRALNRGQGPWESWRFPGCSSDPVWTGTTGNLEPSISPQGRGSFPGTPLRSHSSQDASSSPSPYTRTPLPSAAAQPPTPAHILLSFARDPSPLEFLPGGPGPSHSHPPRKWPLPSRSQRALCWNHVFYHALNLGLHISCLPKHTSFFF